MNGLNFINFKIIKMPVKFRACEGGLNYEGSYSPQFNFELTNPDTTRPVPDTC